MRPRQDLQDLFTEILGSRNVYYQPPESFKLHYPCIIYNRDFIDTIYADNAPYMNHKRYKVTVIDFEPDSPITDAVKNLPMCAYDRSYASDNLYHDVMILYF